MENTVKQDRADADDLRYQVDLWAGFVLANILWAVVGALIVTLPLAMVGLFSVMSARVRGRYPETLHTFINAMREKWRGAAVIGVLDAAVAGFIYLNLSIIGRIGVNDIFAIPSGAVTLFMGVTLLFINLYAWPLLALEDLSPRRLIELSLRFSFGYPLHTLAIIVVAVVPIAVSLLLPRGMFVLLTASCVAYIVSWGTWRIIRRHLTPDELAAYTTPR